MKRWVGCALALGLVVGVAGTAQEKAADPPMSPVGSPYYPIKEGATWTYDVTGGPITVKVVGKEKVKGVDCYKLETSAGGKPAAVEHLAISADGITRNSVNGVMPDAPIRFLNAAPKKGDSWDVDTKVSGQPVKGKFTVADGEKFKLGDKEYETIVVSSTDMEIGSTKTSIQYWFAKDVGIVKLKFTLGTQPAELTLKEFKAGGK